MAPSLRVTGNHSWCHTEDRDVQPVGKKSLDLGVADHGMLEQRRLGETMGEGVAHVATCGELMDVGYPNPWGACRSLEPVCQGEELLRLVVEPLAARREVDVPAVAHEQLLPDLGLQLLDLLGKRRLADEQLGGCATEVQLGGDYDEVAHEAQVDIHAATPIGRSP